MAIYGIWLTRYDPAGRHHSTDEVIAPSWEQVEQTISHMNPYRAPLLWILSEEDNPETNCMAVTGGQGLYHVQIADEQGNWQEARNPTRDKFSGRSLDLRPGITTTREFTWDMAEALQLVRVYFEIQKGAPEIEWR